MKNDPWLEKWIPLIQQKSSNGLLLELGCRSGWDAVDLLSAGCKVIATGLSMENLATTKLTALHADSGLDCRQA